MTRPQRLWWTHSAADLSLVLNELFESDTGVFGQFADSVDLDRIGVYGHSTGGGAAVKTCLARHPMQGGAGYGRLGGATGRG